MLLVFFSPWTHDAASLPVASRCFANSTLSPLPSCSPSSSPPSTPPSPLHRVSTGLRRLAALHLRYLPQRRCTCTTCHSGRCTCATWYLAQRVRTSHPAPPHCHLSTNPPRPHPPTDCSRLTGSLQYCHRLELLASCSATSLAADSQLAVGGIMLHSSFSAYIIVATGHSEGCGVCSHGDRQPLFSSHASVQAGFRLRSVSAASPRLHRFMVPRWQQVAVC